MSGPGAAVVWVWAATRPSAGVTPFLVQASDLAALAAAIDARVAEAVETCAAIVEAFDDDANDGRLREAAARIRAHRAPAARAVVCKARTANHGAGDPPECDWPFCGCDPMADQVLAAIDESGYRLVRDGAPAADTGQEA